MTFIAAVILFIAGVVMLFSPRGNQKPGTKPFAFLVIVISAALVLYKSIVVIPAGHVGVIDFFGTVSKKILRPGINLVNPFADVIKNEHKDQRGERDDLCTDSGGFIDKSGGVSFLYHLNPDFCR